jgi:Calcineurin-like phosphoesterase
MHDLTGNRAVVLRVLQETIDHLAQDQPATRQATARALAPRSEAQRRAERDELVERLQRAYDRAQAAPEVARTRAAVPGRAVEMWYAPRDRTLALLQSAMDEYLAQQAPRARGLLGEQFDVTDPGWISVAVEKLKLLFTGKAPFITHQAVTDFRFPLATHATIAVLGDWGGGNEAAQSVAEHIKARQPDHVIHLGDVYYAGTEYEVRERFLEWWPGSMAAGRSFALNSNHEMYSGGHAYFDIALPAFKQPASYFSLANEHWRFIGLDTGYVEGSLNKEQVEWLAAQLGPGQAKTILLTHHQLFSAYEEQGERLETWVQPFLATQQIYGWLWGHEHTCVVYERYKGIYGRCIGHGCFPYDLPAEPPPNPQVPVKWVNRRQQANGRGMHGFALLTIDGTALHIDYIDQDGVVAYQEDL